MSAGIALHPKQADSETLKDWIGIVESGVIAGGSLSCCSKRYHPVSERLTTTNDRLRTYGSKLRRSGRPNGLSSHGTGHARLFGITYRVDR